MLDMTGLAELWLCEGTELLLFQNKGPDACAIHAPEAVSYTHLDVYKRQPLVYLRDSQCP